MGSTVPFSFSSMMEANSKQTPICLPRMWKNRSPGVETAVCLAPLISWNVSSSRGFGRSGKRRLHASAPNPIVQLNCMSGNRLRMLRIMAEKLAHKSFIRSAVRGVSLSPYTIKTAFSPALSVTSCGMFPAIAGGVFKFISLGLTVDRAFAPVAAYRAPGIERYERRTKKTMLSFAFQS